MNTEHETFWNEYQQPRVQAEIRVQLPNASDAAILAWAAGRLAAGKRVTLGGVRITDIPQLESLLG